MVFLRFFVAVMPFVILGWLCFLFYYIGGHPDCKKLFFFWRR